MIQNIVDLSPEMLTTPWWLEQDLHDNHQKTS